MGQNMVQLLTNVPPFFGSWHCHWSNKRGLLWFITLVINYGLTQWHWIYKYIYICIYIYIYRYRYRYRYRYMQTYSTHSQNYVLHFPSSASFTSSSGAQRQQQRGLGAPQRSHGSLGGEKLANLQLKWSLYLENLWLSETSAAALLHLWLKHLKC